MYPISVAGDLFFIHQELKSIQLRTLNRSRTEFILSEYLDRKTVRATSRARQCTQLLM
jgi:hypothetical protein